MCDKPDMRPCRVVRARPPFAVAHDWAVSRLWVVAQVRSEKHRPSLDLLSVFLGRGVIPYAAGGGQVHKPSADLAGYQAVHRGDLVLNNQQAWRGSVGVSAHHGIVSPAYVVLQLSKALDPRFADYLFQSRVIIDQFVTSSKGVGDIQRDVHIPWLKNTRVPVPSLAEQSLAVRFLNHADGRIRRAIRAKQNLIALLNEQKQAVIHSAVTRGLDPSAQLKPSGVDWLGDVPEHWDVLRLKNVLRVVDARSETGAETLLSLRRNHGVVVFADHFSRPPQAATTVGYKLVAPAQIVVNRLQANNGLIFTSAIPGLISPDYSVFSVAQTASPEYVSAVLRMPHYGAHFRRSARGLGTGTAGFLRLYDDELLATPIALPPLDEQERVMSLLEAATATGTNSISAAERAVNLLREFRTRLIADIVTGKFDVGEVAARLPDEAGEPEPFDGADVEAIVEEDIDDVEPIEA
jgi:type I restriction enzyme S subunit